MIAFYNIHRYGFFSNIDPEKGIPRIHKKNDNHGSVIKLFSDHTEDLARIVNGLENRNTWIAVHFDDKVFFDIAKEQAKEFKKKKYSSKVVTKKKKVIKKKTKK